jgi:rare lipoprotein A
VPHDPRAASRPQPYTRAAGFLVTAALLLLPLAGRAGEPGVSIPEPAPAAAVAAPSAAAAPARTAPASSERETFEQVGCASWYGGRFAGRPTASGEIFDPTALTAAHPSLPFGSLVEITNLKNGRSVVARINDRGPFRAGRIVDCSQAAAHALDFVERGLTDVQLRVMDGIEAPRDVEDAAPAVPPASGETVLVAAAAAGPPAARRAAAYCVQLGAYHEAGNAIRTLRQASVLDVPAFVHTSRRLIHVLVGPFADRRRAAQIQERLAQAGVQGYVRPFHD